jgi:hypothetical protein
MIHPHALRHTHATELVRSYLQAGESVDWKFVQGLLPPEIHVGRLQREHIEAVLPEVWQLTNTQAYRGLREVRMMLTYMATSPAWTGPRPPRFLIWDEDLPSRPQTLPRPVPPNVLDLLDSLLESAMGRWGAAWVTLDMAQGSSRFTLSERLEHF